MAMAMAIHQSNTHLQRDVRNVSQIQFIDGKLKLIGHWYEWGNIGTAKKINENDLTITETRLAMGGNHEGSVITFNLIQL